MVLLREGHTWEELRGALSDMKVIDDQLHEAMSDGSSLADLRSIDKVRHSRALRLVSCLDLAVLEIEVIAEQPNAVMA